jgi:hypothetical protein
VYGRIFEVFVSYVNAGKKDYTFPVFGSQLSIPESNAEFSKELGAFGLRDTSERSGTLALLIETNGKCSLCRKSLLHDKNGGSVEA